MLLLALFLIPTYNNWKLFMIQKIQKNASESIDFSLQYSFKRFKFAGKYINQGVINLPIITNYLDTFITDNIKHFIDLKFTQVEGT